MTKEEYEKLKHGEISCYFKPNGGKHESGFQTFEVGYIELGNDNKCKWKHILGENVDSINNIMMTDFFRFTLDVSLDGYIRILNRNIKWDDELSIMSDAFLIKID